MRISDWSSDVCSSDLRGRWTGPVEALGADPAPAPLIVDALFGVGLSRPLADHLATRLRRFAGRRVLAVDEIGRGSCRERVCQYVSISVVSGTFKNKDRTNHTQTN